MTKLYYDDPLAAAYMAREFGVKYTNFKWYEQEETFFDPKPDERFYRRIFSQIIEWYRNPEYEMQKLEESCVSLEEFQKGVAEIEIKRVPRPSKIHIHPDSYDVFKPTVGDMVRFRDKYAAYVYADDLMSTPSPDLKHANPCYEFEPNKINKHIIQRDNKPFFMPKEEV